MDHQTDVYGCAQYLHINKELIISNSEALIVLTFTEHLLYIQYSLVIDLLVLHHLIPEASLYGRYQRLLAAIFK